MKKISLSWLVLIQLVLALEWLHSGWGKWSEQGFITNIGKSLEGFAAKTPYTTYGTFLHNSIIPNAQVFGNIIRTSEMLVGLAFLIGGIIVLTKKSLPAPAVWLMIVAFFGATFMNLNFFLASGWSSPSTWGVNLVMGLSSLILGLAYLFNRKEISA